MLNFEKNTPEMYPRAPPPVQISKYATVCMCVCVCVPVLELSVFAVATAMRSSLLTSSSSTITARRTRHRLLFTIILTPPTSTRGDVTSTWSSSRRRRLRSTRSHACTPGRTSRPCLMEVVDDASTTISNRSTLFCLVSPYLVLVLVFVLLLLWSITDAWGQILPGLTAALTNERLTALTTT